MKERMVRTCTPADVEAAIATIALAFVEDPLARWAWPEPHAYLTSMQEISRVFAETGVQHGGAHCTHDHGGATLWVPPAVEIDESVLGEIIERVVSPTLLEDFVALFGQMDASHPAEPHWYLLQIGVDPASRGKGYGEALMRYGLERCDQDRVPAYLESANPRNISLYERHGFEPLTPLQVGTSPPVVPMLRPAR